MLLMILIQFKVTKTLKHFSNYFSLDIKVPDSRNINENFSTNCQILVNLRNFTIFKTVFSFVISILPLTASDSSFHEH